mgnify:CR=1 FL=1
MSVHADRLAREGLRFSQTYTIAAHCCPSRATFMTGLFPSQHGIYNNVLNQAALHESLNPGVTTFSEVLRDEGYELGFAGKWHVSATEGPADRGWKEYMASGVQGEMHGLRWERFRTMAQEPESDAPREKGELLRPGWGREASVDGAPLKDDPVVRSQIARLHTDAEVARVMGLNFVAEAVKVEHAARAGKPFQPPTVVASEYKLFATEYSRRLANASMDLGAPGTQLRVKTADAPMEGRPESTYRYTVIDTIGGGSSEIQKNIIARRGLGLPKTF